MTEPEPGLSRGVAARSRPESEHRKVFQVLWLPGTDFLRATCHCLAEKVFDDPIELWTWLLDHPRGHEIGRSPAPPPEADVPAPPHEADLPAQPQDAGFPAGQLSEAIR